MLKNSVAILIPTMNRQEFLLRTISYYSLVNPDQPIFIGDGSKISFEDECIKTGINMKNLYYFHLPGLGDRQTMEKLANIAQKNYEFCVFSGDDDFLVPSSLEKCADFLEHHKDFETAQGRAITLAISKTGPYGKIKSISAHPPVIREVLSDNALDRFKEITSNYWVPNFSVHRTHNFSKNIANGIDTVTDRLLGELVNTFSIIISGKSKFIDCLYLIRNVHDEIDYPSNEDWINKSDWMTSFIALKNIIITTLKTATSHSDSIIIEQVERNVDNLIQRNKKLETEKFLNFLLRYKLYKFLKILKSIACYFISAFPNSYISVETMRFKTSKYFDQMLPIYRITEKRL